MQDIYAADAKRARKAARDEVAAIFAPLEESALECLNEIRGCLGKPALRSLADLHLEEAA